MDTWGVVPLRVIVCVVYFVHGLQNVFGFGHAGTTGAMARMGLPLPGACAAIVMVAELLGGLALLALLFGLFSRWAAAVLAIEMLVAIFVVAHLKHGFFLPTGFEFAFTLLGANLTLLALGAGRLSLDAAMAPDRRARVGRVRRAEA